MKKLIFLLLILVLVLSACSANTNGYPYSDLDLSILPLQNYGASNMWAYSINNVDDLKEHSDIIVRGKVGNPEREILLDTWGLTVYSLEVTAVIEGDDIQVGDQLPYYEPYYVAEDANGSKYLHAQDAFTPSTPGKEYLLFLVYTDNPEGFGPFNNMYVAVRMSKGRYPVPEDMLINWRDFADRQAANETIYISEEIVLNPEFYTNGNPPSQSDILEMAYSAPSIAMEDIVIPESAE